MVMLQTWKCDRCGRSFTANEKTDNVWDSRPANWATVYINGEQLDICHECSKFIWNWIISYEPKKKDSCELAKELEDAVLKWMRNSDDRENSLWKAMNNAWYRADDSAKRSVVISLAAKINELELRIRGLENLREVKKNEMGQDS